MMMRHMGGCASGHLPAVMMAAAAVLGYWVLHHSANDSGSVRRAGQVVGWVLVVVGLGGFLCGAAGHARRMMSSMRQCCVTADRDSSEMQMPPGHPPIEAAGASVEVTVTKKKGK